ncbi:hypothetical protein D3C78_398080 [compost metagenome]
MYAVVAGVASFKAAQHEAGIGVVGLIDLDHLEAPLQRGVSLEVLLVFGPGGGGDGTQFAAGQGGFEQVGGIGTAGLVTCADERVGLVDEQQDRRGRLLHSIYDILQALLELAFYAGTGLQQAEIQCAHADLLEAVRYIAASNPQCQPFDKSGFTDPWLTNQDRVVLAPATEDVDDLADFIVPAEDGVDPTRPGFGGDVLGELVEDGGIRVGFRRGFSCRGSKCISQGSFLLYRLALLGLLIQHGQQAFDLGIADAEQGPGGVAFKQFRRFTQGAQQVRGAQGFNITLQRSHQPGVLDELLQLGR